MPSLEGDSGAEEGIDCSAEDDARTEEAEGDEVHDEGAFGRIRCWRSRRRLESLLRLGTEAPLAEGWKPSTLLLGVNGVNDVDDGADVFSTGLRVGFVSLDRLAPPLNPNAESLVTPEAGLDDTPPILGDEVVEIGCGRGL